MAAGDVEGTILDFAADAFDVPREGLARETELSSLYKNSMRLIKLTARIENELDVEVPLFDVMNMQTLGDLIDRVPSEA